MDPVSCFFSSPRAFVGYPAETLIVTIFETYSVNPTHAFNASVSFFKQSRFYLSQKMPFNAKVKRIRNIKYLLTLLEKHEFSMIKTVFAAICIRRVSLSA